MFDGYIKGNRLLSTQNWKKERKNDEYGKEILDGFYSVSSDVPE